MYHEKDGKLFLSVWYKKNCNIFFKFYYLTSNTHSSELRDSYDF